MVCQLRKHVMHHVFCPLQHLFIELLPPVLPYVAVFLYRIKHFENKKLVAINGTSGIVLTHCNSVKLVDRCLIVVVIDFVYPCFKCRPKITILGLGGLAIPGHV